MPRERGLWYEERGTGNGPRVILSAGLGGSARYWDRNVDALLAAGHRVVLYDHRGTGRSARDLPSDLTIDDMADDLFWLIGHLGIRNATIVGHALGGLIGLGVAWRAPNAVGRVVVVNGFSRPDPHFIRCFEVRLTLLEESGVEAYLHAQPIFLYPAQWSSEHDRQLRAEARDQLRDFQGKENIEARVEALCRADFDARLARIVAPILLIAAEDDMLVPASCSTALAAGLADATLVSMSGGHACNVTQAETFNTILLGWLAGEHRKGAA